MANVKEYKIVINGVTESIDAVASLNTKLQELDTKIRELENRTVNVQTNSDQVSTRNSTRTSTSELSTEDKLLREIENTEERLNKARSKNYEVLIQQKQELKEITNEAKERVAQERLLNNAYSNTMKGLKQELADIKSVMQSTEIGSGAFNDLTKRAGEITNQLKEMEMAYGQFGRNVGNYASAAQGFEKIKIEVNGTTREFDNARQALKELTNERNSIKLMGGDVGDLDNVVKKLKSDLQDMDKSSAVMDNLLDTMQGLVAIASTAEGFASIFGIDDGAIEETIKKLVALQNVLQGIEVIKKQMQTGEGIGGILAKGNAALDSFTKKLFGVSTTAKSANTALNATSAAGKSAATGLGTASVAATTTTKAFSLATAAATALRVALSALGIGLVIGAISLLVEGIGKLVEKQKEAKKYQEDLNKALEEGQRAYAKTQGELIKYRTAVEKFNGTKKQEKQLVDELNSKYGDSLGTYKTLAEWKKVLKERGEILCQVMLKEAQAQALLNMYTEAYIKLQQLRKVASEGGSGFDKFTDSLSNLIFGVKDVFGRKTAQTKANEAVKQQEEDMKSLADSIKKIYSEIGELNKNNNLFNYAPQIEKGAKKTAKATKDAEANLIKLKIELMQDGLAKTLMQLRAEREERIKEAKKTGKLVAEQIALINKIYDNKEIEARKEHYKRLLKIQEDYLNEMKQIQEQTQSRAISNSRIGNENRFEDAKTYQNAKRENDSRFFQDLVIDYNKTNIHNAFEKYWEDLSKTEKLTNETRHQINDAFTTAIAQMRSVDDFIKKYNEIGVKFTQDENGLAKAIFPEDMDERGRALVNGVVETWNNAYSIVMDIQNKFGKQMDLLEKEQTENLQVAFATRFQARKLYYENLLKASKEYYDKELQLQNQELENRIRKEEEAEKKRHKNLVGQNRDNTPISSLIQGYTNTYDAGKLVGLDESQIETYFAKYKEALDTWLEQQDEALKRGEISIEEYTERTSGTLLNSYRKREITFVQFLDNMRQEDETHQNAITTLEINSEKTREQNEKQHLKNMQNANADYYSNMQKEISLHLSAIEKDRDKAETRNAWGIINYKKTKDALLQLRKNLKQDFDAIAKQREDLVKKLERGEITFEQFDQLTENLDALQAEARTTAEGVEQDLEELGAKYYEGINNWVQHIGSAFNSILSSISTIMSNQYDALIDQQDKYIDEYEERLQKQRDITQRYANEVNDIEDELRTARGDRRQHLIDQLNAEMAAQRASLAQEKKIEKEKQKAEEKKKKLEHDQAVAKKRMDLAQAMINAAMAVSMAAVNKWPIPAIPMMALAAAAGAAQVAAVASQRIPSYGSGGVIQGKSHKFGGVKVLGGQAEVEGGEYITNKITTQKNVDLLEYINTKKRKVNLEDLIQFYGGNSQVKKTIQGVRTKFADGGVVPTLSNDINLSDRMLTAFEDYSNRPVQVAVVDIINRADNINSVKVMAGLDN